MRKFCCAISSALRVVTRSRLTRPVTDLPVSCRAMSEPLLQGFGEFKDNLINTYGLYFQDDFHVSSRLTLNFGVRYDPFFPWMEQKNRIEQFTPENYYKGVKSTVYVNAPAGLLFPGDPGVPRWGANPSLNNFSPRLGFAYDLTGDGKTSLRGGAGSFYDSIVSGIVNNRTVDLTPFSPQLSLTHASGNFQQSVPRSHQSIPGAVPATENCFVSASCPGCDVRSGERRKATDADGLQLERFARAAVEFDMATPRRLCRFPVDPFAGVGRVESCGLHAGKHCFDRRTTAVYGIRKRFTGQPGY